LLFAGLGESVPPWPYRGGRCQIEDSLPGGGSTQEGNSVNAVAAIKRQRSRVFMVMGGKLLETKSLEQRLYFMSGLGCQIGIRFKSAFAINKPKIRNDRAQTQVLICLNQGIPMV
jgi:hypothetical protein